MRILSPDPQELALLRADPLLWEQELDVRPEVARDLERAVGRRSGEVFWRSRHDHLYSIELADLGRGLPSMAKVNGWWERFEPRPPEHEIDADLADLCVWVAEVVESLDPADVRRVLQFAATPAGWPAGSVARTPDEPADALPGFDWAPRHVEVEGLRMAYVDVGAARDEERDECFLLLHGEPTWGYLYRRMIPVLAERGRVVVPDLVGFGRSDKPRAANAYTYRSHTRWLHRFVEALDLHGVTLVCQDWGGLLALRVLARTPARFRRLVPMNTGFPCGESPGEAFLAWRQFSQTRAAIDVAALMRRAVRRADFTVAEAAAYAAPFAEREHQHQMAARVFPRLVPTGVDQLAAYENRQAAEVLRVLDLPVLPIWGEEDPNTKPWEPFVRALFRAVEPTVWIAGAGHFLQEDAGEEVARTIVDWTRTGSQPSGPG